MGVLILTLDNTSGTPTHEFNIKLETSLPASSLGLVYYAVHYDALPASEPYVLSLNIPWLNTNTCILRASGHPTDCTNNYIRTQYALSELLLSIDSASFNDKSLSSLKNRQSFMSLIDKFSLYLLRPISYTSSGNSG